MDEALRFSNPTPSPGRLSGSGSAAIQSVSGETSGNGRRWIFSTSGRIPTCLEPCLPEPGSCLIEVQVHSASGLSAQSPPSVGHSRDPSSPAIFSRPKAIASAGNAGSWQRRCSSAGSSRSKKTPHQLALVSGPGAHTRRNLAAWSAASSSLGDPSAIRFTGAAHSRLPQGIEPRRCHCLDRSVIPDGAFNRSGGSYPLFLKVSPRPNLQVVSLLTPSRRSCREISPSMLIEGRR